MITMRHPILNRFLFAFKGRRIWRQITKLYKFREASCLVLMPHNDLELNSLAVEHLGEYLSRKLYDSAIILFGEEDIAEKLEIFATNTKIPISAKYKPISEIEAICAYYRLVQFVDNIVVISVDEPYGSRGLIGKNGHTLNELVKYSILGW